jgi:molybdenum cofactor guanylyltransferase
MSTPKPWAVILAGGEGSRMGGASKALLRLGDQTLIEHVIEALKPQCAGILISIRSTSQAIPCAYPVVQDLEEYGPLGGILAALDWVASHDKTQTSLMSVTTDAPFLPLDMLIKLQEAAEKTGCAFCYTPETIHPLHALWPVATRANLRKFLEQGGRSPKAYLEKREAGCVQWPYPFFLNINTSQDLQEAEQVFLNYGGGNSTP